jgi:hypothetical protein
MWPITPRKFNLPPDCLYSISLALVCCDDEASAKPFDNVTNSWWNASNPFVLKIITTLTNPATSYWREDVFAVNP